MKEIVAHLHCTTHDSVSFKHGSQGSDSTLLLDDTRYVVKRAADCLERNAIRAC